MPYTLPELPYAYDALEPHIDATTMEIHHTKHHAGYVAKLNQAIEGYGFGNPSVEDLVMGIHTLPTVVRTAVEKYGGGHANHSLFWTVMTPGGGEPQGDLLRAIEEQLEGFDAFKTALTNAALERFGSGWAWLCVDPDKRLVVESTSNQDSPLMHGNTPILGIDVWEHAYYLKYQSRRAEYVAAVFEVVHWENVAARYEEALTQTAHVLHAGSTAAL